MNGFVNVSVNGVTVEVVRRDPSLSRVEVYACGGTLQGTCNPGELMTVVRALRVAITAAEAALEATQAQDDKGRSTP